MKRYKILRKSIARIDKAMAEAWEKVYEQRSMIEKLKKEDLPLHINDKWIIEENKELYNKRLME